MTAKPKKSIHPVAVFKEAWGICWENIFKLGAIYLIFNLPVMSVYLTPMASKLQSPKPSLSILLWFFLPVFIISIWGHIALLLSAKKAADLEDYTIGQSISQVRRFFLKYLGTILIIALFFMSVTILGGVSIVIILAFLSKVNKILAALICLVLAIAVIGYLIYFILRWSFASTVCVLEDTRPVAALKRSLALVTNYVHPLVGACCLVFLAYIICMLPIIIMGAFSGISNNPGQFNLVVTIYSIFINMLLVPFWATIIVVLYKKLKEALEANVCA